MDVLIPSSSGCGAHERRHAPAHHRRGLNPFFFRVRCSPQWHANRVLREVLIPSSSGCGAHPAAGRSMSLSTVLIPSSSGCGAHRSPENGGGKGLVLIPSSSGCGAHDGYLLVYDRPSSLNPFFFRVRCSLSFLSRAAFSLGLNPFFFRVRCSLSPQSTQGPERVLIPSSSGCGAHGETREGLPTWTS